MVLRSRGSAQSVCKWCASGVAEWLVDDVEEGLISMPAPSRSDPRHYPGTCSAVTRNASLEAHIARLAPTVHRARLYLSTVYPMASFATASDVEVVRTLRSLEWLYHSGADADADVPLDAIEPSMFAVGSTVETALQCSSSSQEGVRPHDAGRPPSRAILQRDARQLYRGLLPCQSGLDCVRALSSFEPDWLGGITQLGASVYFEVRHFSRIAWGHNLDVPVNPLQPPRTWADFVDPHRVHGSGFWYKHAPGTGVFYHAGRTLVAPTKIAMQVKLLEEWLTKDRSGWPGIETELHRIAARARDPQHWVTPTYRAGDAHEFLRKLRLVSSGERTCAQAQIPDCYDTVSYTHLTLPTICSV